MRKYSVILILSLLYSPSASLGGSLYPAVKQDWSILARSDINNTSSSNQIEYLGYLFERGVRFFQAFISPIDGDNCGMAPTCSTYSRNAFRKKGAFWGFILTFDRLLHEANENKVSPYILDGNIYRILDPVENNISF